MTFYHSKLIPSHLRVILFKDESHIERQRDQINNLIHLPLYMTFYHSKLILRWESYREAEGSNKLFDPAASLYDSCLFVFTSFYHSRLILSHSLIGMIEWQLNYWMRKEWDIFLRDFDFFTLIPGSFHHFWWEKMIKNWSRLIGIRKMSLWTEFNSVQSDNFLRAEGKFWTKVNPLDFFPPHSTLISLFFHHSILIHYLKWV